MTSASDEPRDPRSMELEIELPGIPEQVWEAIATGPGISSWLHPTEVDEQAGTFSFDMGPGMQQAGEVTGWDPPRRFEQTARWQPPGTEASRLASEWLIQARSGDTTVLRLVVSGFGSGAGWDEELEGFRESMRQALETLRLYLTHFPGRHGSGFSVFGAARGSLDEAAAELLAALGIAGAAEGAPVAAGPGVPALSGVVEQISGGAWRRDVVLRLQQPAPGLATVSVYGERRVANVHAHLFGDDPEAVAARERPAWQAWMEARFPTAAPASQARAGRPS